MIQRLLVQVWDYATYVQSIIWIDLKEKSKKKKKLWQICNTVKVNL